MTESELRDHFNQFGDVDYVSIVRDRATKESKGFAYIKYHRMSHAAKAFEDCDRTFKPVFADPKPQKSNYHESNGADRMNGPGSTTSASTTASVSAGYDMLSYMDTSHTNPDGNCRLTVIASSLINQDQLWRLFDLVPGLDYCELKRPDHRQNRDRQNNKSFGNVVFNNPQSATYAKEKLHGFEYPPGHRLIVKFEDMSHGGYGVAPPPAYLGRPGPQPGYLAPPPGPAPAPHNGYAVHHNHNHRMAAPPPHNHHHHHHQPRLPSHAPAPAPAPAPAIPTDLQSLADTIAQATSLIQAAGFAPPGGSPAVSAPAPAPAAHPPGETYDPSYCSVKLPGPQPLAPMDSVVAERLFIVCTPSPPPLYALKDVFGRFGGLIDIYLLNGKTCGYAKYAGKEAAERAVGALHGQEVCGARLKVMPADPQDKNTDTTRKRPKMMEQD